MSLTPAQIKYLRSLAHHRRPVVSVGARGLTTAVIREIGLALKAHELVKIKLPALKRPERQTLFEDICRETRSRAVQHIGRMAVIYRRAPKAAIQLPA